MKGEDALSQLLVFQTNTVQLGYQNVVELTCVSHLVSNLGVLDMWPAG